jgi:hypothetical protein
MRSEIDRKKFALKLLRGVFKAIPDVDAANAQRILGALNPYGSTPEERAGLSTSSSPVARHVDVTPILVRVMTADPTGIPEGLTRPVSFLPFPTV